MEKKPSVFSILGPGKSFVSGIVITFLIIFTIGFFVMWLGTDDNSDKSNVVFGQAEVDRGANKEDVKRADNNQAKQINIKPVTSEDHVKGDIEKAEVVIVEFSDTECPFCKRFHSTMDQVVDEYQGKVAWVYRHFPLDSLHSKARREAEATECAFDQKGNDGFWAYIDKMFEVTPSNNRLEDSQLSVIASQVGLDVAKFESCLADGKYKDKVQAQFLDAQASGGTGTPYSVIITKSGQTIPLSGALPLERIKSMLDSVL